MSETKFGITFKILSVTCVSLALWYPLGFLHKKHQFQLYLFAGIFANSVDSIDSLEFY